MTQVLQNLVLLFFVSVIVTASSIPSQRNVKAESKICEPADDQVDPDSEDYGNLVCIVEDSGDLIFEDTIVTTPNTNGVRILLVFVGYEVDRVSAVNTGELHGETDFIKIINLEEQAAVTANIVNPDPSGQIEMSYQVYGVVVNKARTEIMSNISYT